MTRTVTDRVLAVDAAAVVAVGAALCLAADQLAFMTAWVPVVIALRFVAWSRLPRGARDGSLREEIPFFLVFTVLGAFNDWTSIVRYGVYDYGVPHYFGWSTVPMWMLLYWGLILRFMATVARWRRLGAPAQPDRHFGFGRRTHDAPAARVAVALGLIVGTRQLVYRLYDHPWASWLPFAAALVLYAWLLRPRAHDLRLMALVAVVGPLVEVLYIQVGGLHRYHLGWLGGVPLWIALWWVLATVLWKDLSLRIHDAFSRWTPGPLRTRRQRV